MPTALVKELLEACRAKKGAEPELFKVTMLSIKAQTTIINQRPNGCCDYYSQTELKYVKDERILEKLDDNPVDDKGEFIGHMEMPTHGFIHASWLNKSMPFIRNDKDKMVVIHSIEPYKSYKRAREE